MEGLQGAFARRFQIDYRFGAVDDTGNEVFSPAETEPEPFYSFQIIAP